MLPTHLLGINADLRYSIMSGNEDGMFLLEPRTGVLTLVKQLDYEAKYDIYFFIIIIMMIIIASAIIKYGL